MSPKSGPTRLRELLQQPGISCSLGAHDVFTALIVEQAGFETVFIGGFGTSASMLGLPDQGKPAAAAVKNQISLIRKFAKRLGPLIRHPLLGTEADSFPWGISHSISPNIKEL